MEANKSAAWAVGPTIVDTDGGHRAITFGTRVVGYIREETLSIRDSGEDVPQREHITSVEIPIFGVKVNLRGEHRSAQARELVARTFGRCGELVQRDRDHLGLDQPGANRLPA